MWAGESLVGCVQVGSRDVLFLVMWVTGWLSSRWKSWLFVFFGDVGDDEWFLKIWRKNL